MMKTKSNIHIFAAAMVLLLAASCQKDGVRTLNATFERYEADGKAFVDDDHYACWEDDDMVSVNGTPCTVTLFSGIAQARSAHIVVPEDLDGQNLLAFYPADRISDMSAAGGTVDFPHIQTYRVNDDGRQIIDNPMAAYCPVDSTKLRFRNLGSLLQVTIPNNEDIKAIQVKGVDNQMLCGKARLMFDDNGVPALSPCTDGFNSVTLRFPTPVRANGRSFYIVLPPNTDFEILTIAVLTNNGTSWATHAKTAYMDRVLARNHIAAISYDISDHTDYEFVADWTIRYTATERVDPNESTDWGSFGASEAAYNFGGTKGLIVFDDIITKIGQEAYSIKSGLLSISLPVSVSEIEKEAFHISSDLTSVSMPGVTIVGNNAFLFCGNLESVEMPRVTSMGEHAFATTKLTSVSMPLATSIGRMAFSQCDNLASVEMPKATSIGYGAFEGCTSLTDVTMPLVTSIEDQAFKDCCNLDSVSMPKVTSIAINAFLSCTSLTAVSMPIVTTIGVRAFDECTSLANVYSKTAAPAIGNHAFQYVPATAVLHLPSSLSGTTWSGWTGQYAYDYND